MSFYQPHEGKWACEIQKFCLQYLIRCDPKTGAEALGRALQSRATTGCYKRVLEDVLTDRWDDVVLPVVVPALEDPDNEVALAAAKVLGLHADAANIDKSITALERIDGATVQNPGAPGMHVSGQSTMAAQQILEARKDQLTPEQKQRLQVIANGH